MSRNPFLLRTATLAASIALLLGPALCAANEADVPAKPGTAKAEVGKPLADFRMSDRAGQTHSLSSFKGKTTVLVWTNPNGSESQRLQQEGVLKDMAKIDPAHVKVAKVQVGGVVDPLAGRTSRTATPEQPTTLLDLNNHATQQMGITQTPTVVVLDPTGKIVYRGAVDNDPNHNLPADKKINYAADAVKATLKGEKPKVTSSKTYGSPIEIKSGINSPANMQDKTPKRVDSQKEIAKNTDTKTGK